MKYRRIYGMKKIKKGDEYLALIDNCGNKLWLPCQILIGEFACECNCKIRRPISSLRVKKRSKWAKHV